MKLDYHIFNEIVNGYLALHFDKPRRPTFFNIAKVYLELNAVTKAHPAIGKEFEKVMAEGFSLPEYSIMKLTPASAPSPAPLLIAGTCSC